MTTILPIMGFLAIAMIMTISPMLPAFAEKNNLVCEGNVNGGTFDHVTIPENSHCVLNGVTVNGNISAESAKHVIILYSTVNGNLNVEDTQGVISITNTNFGKNVHLEANDVSIFISVALNTIEGNLQFIDNTAPDIYAQQNTIGKNLICNADNDPVLYLNTNIVDGKINCD